jgi:hypothetical protein
LYIDSKTLASKVATAPGKSLHELYTAEYTGKRVALVIRDTDAGSEAKILVSLPIKGIKGHKTSVYSEVTELTFEDEKGNILTLSATKKD